MKYSNELYNAKMRYYKAKLILVWMELDSDNNRCTLLAAGEVLVILKDNLDKVKSKRRSRV